MSDVYYRRVVRRSKLPYRPCGLVGATNAGRVDGSIVDSLA
jgi:hypothetical protein